MKEEGRRERKKGRVRPGAIHTWYLSPSQTKMSDGGKTHFTKSLTNQILISYLFIFYFILFFSLSFFLFSFPASFLLKKGSGEI